MTALTQASSKLTDRPIDRPTVVSESESEVVVSHPLAEEWKAEEYPLLEAVSKRRLGKIAG
jgi:hypothetical protein